MLDWRLHVAGLCLLLIVPAEAMAPWNSTDMSRKLDADKKEQAKRLSVLNDAKAASSHIDELLTGNQTNLNISQETLKNFQSGNMPLAQQIKDAAGKLQQAEKDLAEKKKALEGASVRANETAESVVKAQAALSEALKNVDEKLAAKNTAAAAEKTAVDKLTNIIITNPQGAQAAQHIADGMKKELAGVEKALDEALHQKDAKQKARASAGTAAGTAREELSNAANAYHDALAKKNSLNEVLKGVEDTDSGPQKKIRLLEKSVEKMEALVSSLDDQSKAHHEDVATKNKSYIEISATVDKDTKCIERLKEDEAKLDLSTHRFNLTASAYESAGEEDKQQMFGALWTIKDQKDADKYALIQTQKDCAPKGVEIPPLPVLKKCVPATKGTCRWLGCKSSRNAICDANYQCACSPGTCASSDGESCVLRESPVFLASPSTELLAEPAAASTVFLAVAALLTTAFLVVRRRRASEIRIPDSVLG